MRRILAATRARRAESRDHHAGYWLGRQHALRRLPQSSIWDDQGAAQHPLAAQAVELVRLGRAALLMTGSLHSDEMLKAITARHASSRTGCRVSHVFFMDMPSYSEPLSSPMQR